MSHRDTTLIVNKKNLLHNYNVYKDISQKNIFAVVKANAYGLGIIEISKILEYNYDSYLCCATFDEALLLREHGIQSPILVLGYTKIEDCGEALKNDITITIHSSDYAKQIDTKNLKVHLKVNTSMNRLGHDSLEELQDTIESISDTAIIEGVYTHYYSSNKESIQKDFDKFKDIVKRLSYDFKYIHAASSNSTLAYEENFTNAVRIGIGLYGGILSHNLKTVATLKSSVVNIRTLKEGQTVSYEGIYTATKDTRVATIPIGYGDGVLRIDRNNKVYIKGKYYSIIGNICMDQMMIEIDSSVEIFDEVEIFGNHISISDIANNRQTINYEVLTGISHRVERKYI